ncbi:MAG: RNA polymerase subunit sigma-70, partial [Eubacteriales bacterium]|nr:RNA polymerase subunit sigma-70 [Eubacteriales bacterium]
MDDKQIVDLYWERSEAAISETAKKYGRYCNYIAFNVLHNDEDSEECVND